MKFLNVIVTSALIFCVNASYGQGVAVNTTGTRADTSAILDVSSTTQGLLPPRMAKSQRDAIILPATGLVIYQTDSTPGLYVNNGVPSIPVWAISYTAPAFGAFFNYGMTIFGPNVYDTIRNLSTIRMSNLSVDSASGTVITTAAGVYHFTFTATVHTDVSAPAATTFNANIIRNGYATDFYALATCVNGNYATISGDFVMPCSAGDYFNLQFESDGATGYVQPLGSGQGVYWNIIQIQ